MRIRFAAHVVLAALVATGVAALEPPGSSRTPELSATLLAAYRARGEGYAPRTRHRDGDGRAKYVNRLITEVSPYLLQHAHNPVDWRPWGPEALAEAQALDRPIFLSVGYSTCHWCHVMEVQSFEDETVAALLNAHFIPIKVDREERPDLDQVYVLATQLQRGHAGWPNSLFLTPQGHPFFTGTYLARDRFLQVLNAMRDEWRSSRRAGLVAYAGRFAATIREHANASRSGTLGPDVYARAVAALAGQHNELQGGFGSAAQFPQEGHLLFLLDHWRRTGESVPLAMVARTLDAIARGGIHDHVGGGFHRYTVDPNWRTPHFEKMLYTQALLARAFVEAWQITGNAAYSRAATRAFDYVLRDMSAPDGAFYTAEDADSPDSRGEMAEGAFYVLSAREARAVLGDDGAWAVGVLGLAETATLESGPVVHLAGPRAVDFARLEGVLERLRRNRERRARPLRDEKVIAGWNGLMIRALAEGGLALSRPGYVASAARAADATLARLWHGGTLARLHAGGRAQGEASLDDHAWLGLALVALGDGTGDARWLALAEQVAARMQERFADGRGRLKMAAADGPLGPVYSEQDAATPSGESSALELFVMLHHRSPSPEHARNAASLLTALAGAMTGIPTLRTVGLVAARGLADGESGAVRILGKGVARVVLERTAGGWRLALHFADGWHANAHEPASPRLIGAQLRGADVSWPAGTPLATAFTEMPVMVYDGTVTLPLASPQAVLELTLQICSSQVCLQPESARFRIVPDAPMPAGERDAGIRPAPPRG